MDMQPDTRLTVSLTSSKRNSFTGLAVDVLEKAVNPLYNCMGGNMKLFTLDLIVAVSA